MVRTKTVTRSMRATQVGLAVLAAALLAAHTYPKYLAEHGVAVTVDTTSLGLVVLLIIAAMLPRVRVVRAAGIEIALGEAEHAGAEARALAGPEAGTGIDQGAMRRAAEEPLVSVEASRRAVAAQLRALADTVGIVDPPGDLGGLADRLVEGGHLPRKVADAVKSLAESIRTAKLAGASPAVALEIDFAAQLLQGVIAAAPGGTRADSQ